jgi:phage FluMu protein Com
MAKNETTELRCDCGKLLFKKTTHGFEYKCNRCKRIHLIPFDSIGSEFQSLCPVDDLASKDEK